MLWCTHWNLAWLYVVFTKRTATIPTPKVSSGWGRRQEWSTKQNINISHSEQVTQCESQKQSAYISPEFMPMTRPLNNSLPLLWWLVPEECIDFCWHWKDAQKIKIMKSSGNSLCRDKKLLLNDAWTGPVSERCFPQRAACEFCLLSTMAWETEGRSGQSMSYSKMLTSLQRKAGTADKCRGFLWRILADTDSVTSVKLFLF